MFERFFLQAGEAFLGIVAELLDFYVTKVVHKEYQCLREHF